MKYFKIKLLVSVFFLSFFYACSWQEYFVIINESNKEILIEYSIINTKSGFPIFDADPSNYKLNSSSKIEWMQEIQLNDNDTSLLMVKQTLPPKMAIVIGRLSNDNYEKYNQYFINGRKFNLKKLTITQGAKIIEIVPETFDNYFQKKNGNISFNIADS